MIGAVFAVLIVLVTAAAAMIWMLARRVVRVKSRRKALTVRVGGGGIELPRSELTIALGEYGLWFGERFEHHALIGSVVSSDANRVVRRVLKAGGPFPSEPFEAQWTGHIQSGPADIDPDWEEVVVPLRDGGSAPAWLFHGASADAPWVIHVQGIRTSRVVTLRSVEVAHSAGLTSLAITYRGSGDGPAASASTLGQREWTDLADAIAYARSSGAPAVYVVAWSMGAGLALELLRHDPGAIDRLALIAPATQWRGIIRHAVDEAGLPNITASTVIWALSSPALSKWIGLSVPLELNRLDWTSSLVLEVPALVIHSAGDREIPLRLTREFVKAQPTSSLAETAPAPHGWEANVDPEVFRSALRARLT